MPFSSRRSSGGGSRRSSERLSYDLGRYRRQIAVADMRQTLWVEGSDTGTPASEGEDYAAAAGVQNPVMCFDNPFSMEPAVEQNADEFLACKAAADEFLEADNHCRTWPGELSRSNLTEDVVDGLRKELLELMVPFPQSPERFAKIRWPPWSCSAACHRKR